MKETKDEMLKNWLKETRKMIKESDYNNFRIIFWCDDLIHNIIEVTTEQAFRKNTQFKSRIAWFFQDAIEHDCTACQVEIHNENWQEVRRIETTNKDEAQLRYIIMDGIAAVEALPSNPKCKQYLQEIIDCATELKRRIK